MASGTITTVPLSPAVLAILLSLAEGERSGSDASRAPGAGKHGYLIMKDARSAEGGGIKMGPGTLYGSLDRMMRDGLVEESGFSDDERRRFYRLTQNGRAALATELARLDAAISSARSLGLIPHGGR